MLEKQPRDKILYARVKTANILFIRKDMKKLGYARLTEYIDAHFDEIRIKKVKRASKKK